MGDALSIQAIDSLRRRPGFVIAVTQLSKGVVTPGVDSALASHDDGQAALGYLIVLNLQLLDALDSVGSVELAKDTTTPDKQLLVSRHGRREAASANLDHLREAQLLQ